MDIIHGAKVIFAQSEYNRARSQTRSLRIWIESKSSLTLACRLVQQASIAKYDTQDMMGVGTVGTPAHEVFGFLESFYQFSPFDVKDDKVGGGGDIVGIQSQSPGNGSFKVFDHGLPAIGTTAFEMILSPQHQPGGRER